MVTCIIDRTWYILVYFCSGGSWVNIASRRMARHGVPDKPKTYVFRLTVTEKIKDVVVSDTTKVTIVIKGK